MSIYSELLRIALTEEAETGGDESSVGELVDRLVERRLELMRSTEEMAPSSTRAAEWAAVFIAQDVALVRLCERLGIEQRLTDPSAPPTERDRIITMLAARRIDLLAGDTLSME